MAKLTQKEFMEKLDKIIGDRTDNEALNFIEDCKDTISSEGDDWKAKYDEEVQKNAELEKTWREKYKARFFAADESSINNPNENNNKTNPAKPKDTVDDDEQAKLEQAEKIRFDDLFTPAN